MAELTDTQALAGAPPRHRGGAPEHRRHADPRDRRGPGGRRGRERRRRPAPARAPDRRALRPGRDRGGGRGVRRAAQRPLRGDHPRPAPRHPRHRRRRHRDRAVGRGPRRDRRGAVARGPRSSAASCAPCCSVLAERRRSRRLPELLRTTTEPGALADGFGAWSDMPTERKVELLEAVDTESRVERALEWARDALAEHEVTEKIRQEVGEGMEKQQREFLLRQQLQAIRKELGEGGEDGNAIEELREKAAETELPESVERRGDQGDRQARAHVRAEPRARLDPHVARHDPRAARGACAPRSGSTSPKPAASSTPTTPVSAT